MLFRSKDYLKSPTGGGGELSEGISDSCGGETTGGGGTNGPNGFGNSNAQIGGGDKMALSTSAGKKEKNKEKKKRAKRTGSGAGKNDAIGGRGAQQKCETSFDGIAQMYKVGCECSNRRSN